MIYRKDYFLVALLALIVGCKSNSDSGASTASNTPPASSAPSDTSSTAPPAPSAAAGSTAGATAPSGDNSAAGGHNLVGSWEGSDKASYTFNTDGTFESTMIPNQPKATLTLKGTYKLEGDQISVAFTDMSGQASDPKDQPEIDKELAAAKKEMKPETDPVKWNSDDEVVLIEKHGSSTQDVTLKRKSS